MLHAFRLLVAAGFITPGVLHFTHLEVFLVMMPPYLPWHRELVWLSGAAEIVGGVGLLHPTTRRAAAWGLLALLVAVFPANVHMALHDVTLPIDGLAQSSASRWLRLPLQAVMAWQVWFVGLRRPPAPDTD